MASDERAGRRKRTVWLRSEAARAAHLRSGAGAMGGSRKAQARRRRRENRQDERAAARESAESGQ